MAFQCPNFVLWTTLREGDVQNGYIRGLQIPACSRWRDSFFPATICFKYEDDDDDDDDDDDASETRYILHGFFTSPQEKSVIGPPLMPMLSLKKHYEAIHGSPWSPERFLVGERNLKGKRFEDYIMPGETSNKNMDDFGKDVENLKKVAE